ncbi:MAG: hypothetical protein P4L45_01300 [Ignavibacteriaceae bacterium]|nr:hypothetical protein [Ignavibacteriaceae bacterium]
MMAVEEKNNPPVWFIIAGILFISIVAYFVIMAPTKPYTPDNQYYLKDAQSSVTYNGNFIPAQFS